MIFIKKGTIFMNLIAVLIALAIIIVAFKFNVFLGIAVAIVAIGVGIYNFLPTYYAINGNKAFEIGDEDRAREWYKKACETGRANVKLKSSYAYVLLRTGYADEAEKVLDPIIRVKGLAPEKKNLAKQQRCMVYYKQGRLDEAIEDAQSMMNEVTEIQVFTVCLAILNCLETMTLTKQQNFVKKLMITTVMTGT
ncbi:tetratricopeptide repeat protein [Firmicutes bacterium AF36-3BH]|nr:tetratricopeptide repeat protein [Firmicutes bacterium AF36-3BH]